MRNYWAGIVTAAFLSGFAVQRADANGPPIQSESAFVVGLHGAAVRSFFKSIRKSKLLQEGSEIADPKDRQVTVRTIPLIIPYELISNKLIVGISVPYLDKKMELTENGSRSTLKNNGIGDLQLFGKLGLYQEDHGSKTTRIAGKLSIKLPSGRDNDKDSLGDPLPIGLQLGTGSTDISIGSILTHLYRRFGINGGLHYTFKTKANEVKHGDALKVDLALAFRAWPNVYETYPSPQWNLFFEWNGVWEQKRKIQGQTISDSGGNTLFLSPGIQFMGGRTWLLEFSYQMPILQELNGTQLGVNHTVLAGFRWLIW